MTGEGVVLGADGSALTDKPFKKLLIAVPLAPGGKPNIHLVNWLTGIQIEAQIKEFAWGIADKADFSVRHVIEQSAERFATAHAMEQASMRWVDLRKLRDMDKPMLPPDWTVTVIYHEGRPIAENRNTIMKRFLWSMDWVEQSFDERDFDAVLQIDSDMVPGKHDLWLLLHDLIDHEQWHKRKQPDIVGGVYCMAGGKVRPHPIVYLHDHTKEKARFDTEVMTRERGLHYLPNGTLPGGSLLCTREAALKFHKAGVVWFLDVFNDGSPLKHELEELLEACGDDHEKFGIAVRDHMLEIQKSQATIMAWGKWRIGEDIWFFRQAQRLGLNVYVDTRCHWTHFKEVDLKAVFEELETTHMRGFARGQEAYSKGRIGTRGYTSHMRQAAKLTRQVVDAEEALDGINKEHDGAEVQGS